MDLTLAVNLTGYARMMRACLPHLLEAGGGRIVNIASTEGLGATPGISPYTASKHGVVGPHAVAGRASSVRRGSPSIAFARARSTPA